jgi:hypothetical protein
MLGTIDFISACGWYLAITVLGVLAFWVVRGFRERSWMPDVDPESHVWECATCTHVYLSPHTEDVTNCPLCQSYNEWTEGPLKGELGQ